MAHAALNGTEEEFYAEIAWHKELFGDDYYLELQRHGMKRGEGRNFRGDVATAAISRFCRQTGQAE